MRKNTLIGSSVVLALLSLPSLADNTNIGVDTNAAAVAQVNNVVIPGGPYSGPYIGGVNSGGKTRQTLFLPNSGPNVSGNAAKFVNSVGLSPAEKAAGIAGFMARACSFTPGGVASEIIENDSVVMNWLQFSEVKNGGGVTFGPLVYDIVDEFSEKDTNITHYCLGKLTIKAVSGDSNSVLRDPLTLVNDALMKLKEEGKLSGHIIPVLFYEQVGYYESLETSGGGWQINPQGSGGPAGMPLMTAMFFSFGENSASATPNFYGVPTVFFLQEAPNESLGHPIIRNIVEMLDKLRAVEEKRKQEEEQRSSLDVGIKSAGSRR